MELTVTLNTQITCILKDQSETSIEQMQTETYRKLLTELIRNKLHVDDVLIEDLKIFISKEDENA